MTMENEVSQILTIVSANQKTLSAIVGLLEVTNGTLTEILAACAGKGSDELVQALNNLTKQIVELRSEVKELPEAVANEVG